MCKNNTPPLLKKEVLKGLQIFQYYIINENLKVFIKITPHASETSTR